MLTSSNFPRNWPFVRGIHRGQWPVTRSFDVFCDLRLNHRLKKNNREAGDLRRYHAHYDITVMYAIITPRSINKTPIPNDTSIVMQIRLKTPFAVVQFLVVWSKVIVAHAPTASLSCNVLFMTISSKSFTYTHVWYINIHAKREVGWT